MDEAVNEFRSLMIQKSRLHGCIRGGRGEKNTNGHTESRKLGIEQRFNGC